MSLLGCLENKISGFDVSSLNFPLWMPQKWISLKFCKAYKEDIFYLRHSGRESWLEGNSIMRHPGRKVLLSIQGGHFLFEAFREGKLVLKYPWNSVFKHSRRRIYFWGIWGGKFNFGASREVCRTQTLLCPRGNFKCQKFKIQTKFWIRL